MERELKQSSFEKCMEKGELRRIPPSKEKAEGSIKAAWKWLDEAKINLKSKAYNSSVLSSYLAMFHSARSILYFDGFREKSQYCVARYLEEMYVKKDLLKSIWIDLLDHYRNLRHRDQYNMSFFATNNEAEKAIKTAEDFTRRIETLLKEKASE